MTEFPTLVYKDKGPYQRIGGTYDFRSVRDKSEYDDALASGWRATLSEIVEGKQAQDIPDDVPLSRAELESKANEFGIKFDGRTTDKKLASMIYEALGK